MKLPPEDWFGADPLPEALAMPFADLLDLAYLRWNQAVAVFQDRGQPHAEDMERLAAVDWYRARIQRAGQ